VSKSNRLATAVLKSPVVWGGLASFGFYELIRAGLIGSGPLAGEFFQRYFASHPVEYAATTMFFIGLAALALKLLDVFVQYRGIGEPILPRSSSAEHSPGDCDVLLTRLDRLPRRRRGGRLAGRLRDAIGHVRRRGTADGLDDHLRYLAEADADRLYGGFAMVRVIIWAIPILGFLGTVIGITLAIANLAPDALESSLPEVTKGLGVAFDTTALALGLSIVLMFAQFLTDRAESALLERIDGRAADELEGRFEHTPDGPDGQLLAVRRMAETVVQVTEELVRRQAAIWQDSMDAAAERWSQMTDVAEEKLQQAMAGALNESLKIHAQELATSTRSTVEAADRHWQRVQESQTKQAESLAALQSGLVKQGDVLHRAVGATGDVLKLEEALNHNLASLAGAKNFEKTVMSLAAAIHLLNGRLSDQPTAGPVQLESADASNQAA